VKQKRFEVVPRCLAEFPQLFVGHLSEPRSQPSFAQHLLRQDVTRAGQYGRILAIRNKRAVRGPANHTSLRLVCILAKTPG
jgi:hypothetical protein